MTVRLPGPDDLVQLSPAEGRARAQGLVLADLGRLDRAERGLLTAMRGRLESGLRDDVDVVRGHREGITRGMATGHAAGVDRPDLTVLEYWQLDRQHDHHVAVRRPAVVCAWFPVALMAVLALHALFGWTAFAELFVLLLGVVVLSRTRDSQAREVRRGLVRAVPLIGVLRVVTALLVVASVLAVHLVLLDVALDRRPWDSPLPTWVVCGLLACFGLLALAWRWSALLATPPGSRADHRSLWAEDDPIATTSGWARCRGVTTVGLLVLGLAGVALFRAGDLQLYAGVPLVAAGVPQLSESLTFWARRLRGSRRGGFKTPPGLLDQLLAAVPVVLVVASFVI